MRLTLPFIPALILLIVPFCSIAQQPVRIGVSIPLSGDAATIGEDIRNALIMANEQLAGGRYNLIFDDDKCNARDAVAIAHRFSEVEHLKYVLGYGCSSCLLSAAPVFERAGITVISPAASAPQITHAGTYIYRTWPSDAQAAYLLAGELRKNFSIVGVLTEETDFAQGMLEAFKRSGAGMNIINEYYATGTTDVRPMLMRLKARKVPALFINSQTEATYLNSLRQARELRLKARIFGTYFPFSRAFLDPAGELANGIRGVDAPSPAEALTSSGAGFLKEFTARFGPVRTLDLIPVAAWESFRAMHLAIESGQEPRKFLNSATFEGFFGRWSFDRNGDITGINPVIREIRDGKAVSP